MASQISAIGLQLRRPTPRRIGLPGSPTIAGAMIGAAPKGRRKASAARTAIGVFAGLALALMPGGFGFLLAPIVVIYAGWTGMHETGGGQRPTAQL